MLDLETLGTSANALILSIGAVKFDPMSSEILDSIEIFVDPVDAQRCGGRIDASTVIWWMDETRQEARTVMMAQDNRHDLPTALGAFSDWFGPESLPVWGNGALFDNLILANAYAAIGEPKPWTYKHDNCFRTLRTIAPGVACPETTLIRHSALGDATIQAHWMQVIIAHLGLQL
jgi:exodeoxyribonuclease VIII